MIKLLTLFIFQATG